jgi:Zn-dependent protease/CBS domain-containing protein
VSSPAPPRAPAAEVRKRSEGWQVAHLAGVPVVLARSWLVIAALITLLFADTVLAVDPRLGLLGAHAVAFGYAVLLLLSVLVHELAHAVTARALGMTPTRIVLTLWGGHTSFAADARSPAASFLVSAAGPASNAALAVGAYVLLLPLDLPSAGPLLVQVFALANAFVAVTNVLPGLPLDGGRMLEAAVWAARRDRDLGTVVAGWSGRLLAVALPVLVALSWAAGGSAPSVVTLAWAALVGALLWAGAGSELAAARVRRRSRGTSLRALARPAVAVAGTAPLARALAAAAGPGAPAVVVTGEDGAASGVLDLAAAERVPAERRDGVPVGVAEVSLTPGAVLPGSLTGAAMLRALARLPREPWVVVDDDGRVRGVLTRRDVEAGLAARRPGRGSPGAA